MYVCVCVFRVYVKVLCMWCFCIFVYLFLRLLLFYLHERVILLINDYEMTKILEDAIETKVSMKLNKGSSIGFQIVLSMFVLIPIVYFHSFCIFGVVSFGFSLNVYAFHVSYLLYRLHVCVYPIAYEINYSFLHRYIEWKSHNIETTIPILVNSFCVRE